jgi:hypothetical protein
MYRIVVSALPGDSNEIFGSKASSHLGNRVSTRIDPLTRRPDSKVDTRVTTRFVPLVTDVDKDSAQIEADNRGLERRRHATDHRHRSFAHAIPVG